MEELKQYTFIKPDTLTIEQKYNIYLNYIDTGNYVAVSKENFYETYKDRDHLSSIFTYYMEKYQTTPVDFTFANGLNNTIFGIIVDNNVKYKKRIYQLTSGEHLKTGDNILFIKPMSGWGYYLTCIEIEEKLEQKSTLRHLAH